MKKFLKLSFPFVQVAVLCALVLSSVYNVSCRVSTQGIQLLSGDYESPELLSVASVSPSEVLVRFSEEVKINGISLCEYNSYENSFEYLQSEPKSVPLQASVLPDKTQVSCKLDVPTIAGKKYIAFGQIEDKNGNSLTFSSCIVGFNANMATVVLSEIQDKTTAVGGCEFIELYVLEPGNLAGLVISSANDGKEFDYTFPSIEVKAKDVVVLHLRSTENGCISELSDDLSLSTATGSKNSARDIWIENTENRLGATQDVILLTDSNTGTVKDAFLYSRTTKNEWVKNELKEAAEKAFESGIWKDGSAFENAFLVDSSSAQLIFSRKNIAELDYMAETGTLNADCISVNCDDWIRETPKKVNPGSVSNVGY